MKRNQCHAVLHYSKLQQVINSTDIQLAILTNPMYKKEDECQKLIQNRALELQQSSTNLPNFLTGNILMNSNNKTN